MNKMALMLSLNTTESSGIDPNSRKLTKSFEIISSYQGDPFVGHLSTPITTSKLVKNCLSALPAYNTELSPLLIGINIGLAHGYFLLGPFTLLGPLRSCQGGSFIAFISTISLVLILAVGLLMYGYVTFKQDPNKQSKTIGSEFLSYIGWRKFTSGFTLGGFGGCGIAYALLKVLNYNIGF